MVFQTLFKSTYICELTVSSSQRTPMKWIQFLPSPLQMREWHREVMGPKVSQSQSRIGAQLCQTLGLLLLSYEINEEPTNIY